MHLEPSSSLGSFPDTLQDLPGIRLDAGSGGQAFLAAQGAQVLSWQASDGIERMYLSPTSGGLTREGGNAAAIRGGVPVCFPQFSDRGTLVKHGFARNVPWQVGARGPASLAMTLHDDDASRRQWPHAFNAQVGIRLEPGMLEVSFKVANTGDAAFQFTAALHTYLRVQDIRRIRLVGLQNVAYEDATDGCIVKTQNEPGLSFPGEVDRVYMNTPGPMRMVDDDRTLLTISQRGFFDTVVWNPGPDKARLLADMPDDGWLHMLCVEAACASRAVMLLPGESWEGSQQLGIG